MLVFHFCLPPGTPPSVCSPSACSFASPSAPAPRLDPPGIHACVSLLHAARPPRRPGLLPLASMLVFHCCLPPGTPPSVCSPSACSFASPSAPAPRLDRPGIHACVSLLHAARPRLDRPGIHACLGLIALASMLVFHCCMPLVLLSSDLISLAPRLLYFRKRVLVCQPVRPGAQ